MLRKQLEIQDNFIMTKKIISEEEPEEIRSKFLTYFLLFFPTLILIAIPDTINSSIILSASFKMLIAFYQFVTMKTFVDKHYE